MQRSLFLTLILICSFLFVSCAPATSSGARFFYVRMGATPTLMLLDSPESRQPRGEIPLAAPADCSFWSLTPAPVGPFAALEWQCPFGPLTELVNVGEKSVGALLDDVNRDSHFLAWSADGKSIYLKTGATTQPQIMRVDVASHQATVMKKISLNTYNLTVSPTEDIVLWAFSDGIGFGSQLWASTADGSRTQMVLSDPGDIISLMRFAPDGKHIVAIRMPDNKDPLPAGELWLADSDGKHAHFTATADAGRGMFPVWSADGAKIAFIGRSHPNDPASINLSVLTFPDEKVSTFDVQPAFPPVWSPDGDSLYFTQGADGKMELWSYKLSTGASQKLFDSACCAGWVQGIQK
jgi:Tol biopolymer transport system component